MDDLTIRWDGAGNPFYASLGGHPYYLPPAIAEQTAQQHPELDPDGRLTSWAQQHQRPGGSLLKNSGTWNPQTGTWDQGINWGNIATLATGGILTAGLADAALAGGAAAAGGGSAAAPELAPVAGAGLEAAPITATTLPAATGATAAAPLSATATAPIASAALPAGAASAPIAASVAPAAAGGSMAGFSIPASVWVPSAIGAGAQIYGASKAAGAAKDAAKIQSETADKALALQERMYQQDRSDLGQSRADLAPYRGLGSGAANLLAQGLGFQLPAYTPPGNVQAAAPMMSKPTAAPEALPTTRPQPTATPTAAPMASLMGPANQQTAAQAQTQSSYAVKAPNGNIYQIPAAQLQQALANGGQQV